MATYSNSVSETVGTTSPVVTTAGMNNSISVSLQLSASKADNYILNHTVLDYIISISSSSSTATLKSLIIENTVLYNYISTLFKFNLSDSISSTSSVSFNVKKYESVINNIIASSTYSQKITAIAAINDYLSLLNSLDRSLFGSVTEAIVIQNSISELYKLLGKIIDSINIVDSKSIYLLIPTVIDDLLSTLSSTSIKGLFSGKISENLLVIVGDGSTNSTYIGYLLSPETNSVSNYNNYNFISSTKFGNKYLFSNSSGLYEYGGSTDNGDSIRSEVETVAFNFNSSNLKQVPAVYLGISSDSTVILKVKVDGKGEAIYKLNRRTNNLQTQKMDIGKGLIGRYFQFELITSAPTFNLE